MSTPQWSTDEAAPAPAPSGDPSYAPPPLLHEEMKKDGIDSASVLEDDKLTEERYEEIKARTMFSMLEDIDGGKQSLLFLTNKQAELLASPESLAKPGHVDGTVE